MNNEWIDVKDKLPLWEIKERGEDISHIFNDKILICIEVHDLFDKNEDREVFQVMFSGDKGWCWDHGKPLRQDVIEKIIYWMPMPESPPRNI